MEHLIKKYCNAWNNLSTVDIINDMHDDIEHHSQVVLEVLNGKQKVIDYLDKKFASIKKGNEPVRMYPVKHQDVLYGGLFQLIDKPEVSPFVSGPGNKKKPYRFAVIAFKFKEDKIVRTCLCIIPTVEEVEFL